MNIFFLDECPIKAAQYQCDKHVVKMILESAQLLSTAHHECPNGLKLDLIYKPTHKNHPCAKWSRACIQNYDWLRRHAIALCDEYTFRYGKTHKSRDIINICSTHIPAIPSFYQMTSPAQAMPDEYKCFHAVTAYRNYYRGDKLKNIDCRWTVREIPQWL